jgi:hypothetical protein
LPHHTLHDLARRDIEPFTFKQLALGAKSVNHSHNLGQGNRMKIAFCRTNVHKDGGRKHIGFPPSRESRSEYSTVRQQNVHSIALQSQSQPRNPGNP